MNTRALRVLKQLSQTTTPESVRQSAAVTKAHRMSLGGMCVTRMSSFAGILAHLRASFSLDALKPILRECVHGDP